MCAHVYEMEMEAHRSLNDSEPAILAGEKALKGAPNNLAILAELAYIMADSGADPPRLDRAAELASTEIETAKNLRLPRSIAPTQAQEIHNHWGGHGAFCSRSGCI